MKWHYIKNGDKPKALKDEKKIPCILESHNGYELCYWETFSEYWYDQYDDKCDIDQIERWAYVEDETHEPKEICDQCLKFLNDGHYDNDPNMLPLYIMLSSLQSILK